MRLRRKMDNGVDFVPTEHTLHSSGRGDVALLECEVRSAIENARVVERCAVIQPVQGNHIIVGVCKDYMAYEPAGSVSTSVLRSRQVRKDAHVALPVVSMRRT